MTSTEIKQILQQHFSDAPGYSDAAADEFASGLATAVSAAGIEPSKQPTPKQQACYKACETTRDAALAACALKGWPAGAFCAGQAVLAFNACRHQCDQHP